MLGLFLVVGENPTYSVGFCDSLVDLLFPVFLLQEARLTIPIR
jgi:hypothetical protein